MTKDAAWYGTAIITGLMGFTIATVISAIPILMLVLNWTGIGIGFYISLFIFSFIPYGYIFAKPDKFMNWVEKRMV